MNREELAWAAGFFDGEGTTYCKPYRALSVSVGQAGPYAPVILERFCAATGLGKVYGPYNTDHRANRQEVYRCQVSTFEACQAVVAMLWPWLSEPKRVQAKMALLAANVPKKPSAGAMKTHCPAGHPYDEENTLRGFYAGYPRRICRACAREHARKYRRTKAAV